MQTIKDPSKNSKVEEHSLKGKNFIDEINSRLEMAREKTSELQEGSIVIEK